MLCCVGSVINSSIMSNFITVQEISRKTKCFSRIKDIASFDSKFKESPWLSRTSGNVSCSSNVLHACFWNSDGFLAGNKHWWVYQVQPALFQEHDFLKKATIFAWAFSSTDSCSNYLWRILLQWYTSQYLVHFTKIIFFILLKRIFQKPLPVCILSNATVIKNRQILQNFENFQNCKGSWCKKRFTDYKLTPVFNS